MLSRGMDFLFYGRNYSSPFFSSPRWSRSDLHPFPRFFSRYESSLVGNFRVLGLRSLLFKDPLGGFLHIPILLPNPQAFFPIQDNLYILIVGSPPTPPRTRNTHPHLPVRFVAVPLCLTPSVVRTSFFETLVHFFT